jgi:glycosyltransferase involved in cell wall biosynthesis
MIRVLHIVESTTAGVKRYVLGLVQGLDRARFHVAVACPLVRSCAYDDTGFVAEVQQNGAPVHLVPMQREISPLADGRALLALLIVLRRGHYDLLHAHSSKAGVLARLAAVLWRLPVAYTPNGFAFHGIERTWRGRVYLTMERLLRPLTAAVLCSSEAERSLAVDHGVALRHKTHVIENSIDPGVIAPVEDVAAERVYLGLHPTAPLIATIGRLTEGKAFDDLLRACARLSAAIPDAQLLVIGSGEDQAALETLAVELGIAGRTRFLGHRDDAPRLVGLGDVFALTTRHEAGVPYVALEAMSQGLPVVAFDLPELAAIASHDAGILVPGRDPSALAEAMRTLLDDPARRQAMGETGRRLVNEQFHLRWHVARMEQLYLRLVSARGPAR